jgi:hypothetical protein
MFGEGSGYRQIRIKKGDALEVLPFSCAPECTFLEPKALDRNKISL